MKLFENAGAKITSCKLKNNKLKNSGHKKRKIWILALAGAGLICFSALWIIKAYSSSSDTPGLPVEQNKLNVYVSAMLRPGKLNATEKQTILRTIASLPDSVRGPVIRLAARQSIEEVRAKFKGLTTPEDKQKKVDEIIAYIDKKYVIDQDTSKVFNQEFLNEAIQVYVKEVPAEERALYEPIVNKLVAKLNLKSR